VDDTARAARTAGAEVVERHDLEKRGKGYALDRGIRHLSANPPEIVIMVDADCQVCKGTVGTLAAVCAATGRPAQALNLMTSAGDCPINHQIAEFAWCVKNLVRPLGLHVLNLPCQLMGTGMAFPWDLIQSADLANANIVEDLKLGLEMAKKRRPPIFCPDALVISYFPHDTAARDVQRRRWEQGHLAMIALAAPRFALQGLASRNLPLVALTLDMFVPPLSFLGLSVSGALLSAALFAESSGALVMSTFSFLAFALGVLVCWWKYGRDTLPIGSVWLILPYVIGKARLYGQILLDRRLPTWARTDRKKLGL
jgi:hypothetical protein